MRGSPGGPRRASHWAAGALLLAVGAVHLYLYAGSGYRFIPTIGWLFLAAVVAAAVLAVAVVASPGVAVEGAATLFSIGVLGAYLLCLVLPAGLFDFTEPGVTAAGWVAIAAEAGTASLLARNILRRPRRGAGTAPGRGSTESGPMGHRARRARQGA